MAAAWLGLSALAAAGPVAASGHAALTGEEQRWIAAGAPVLAWARAQGLAVDIIVQPTEHPELSPLSMAYIGGRCKLVLSMRGNPMVAQHLEGVPQALHGVLIEVMTAHEVGHCWRHAQGAWQALPAGFASAAPAAGAVMRPPSGGPASSREAQDAHDGQDAQAQRREEGFADLVGLAWAWSRHPQHYRRIHDWLLRERGQDVSAGESGSTGAVTKDGVEHAHDTSLWVELARDAAVFGSTGDLFEQAQAPWEAGLRGSL
jgi:hypothetical protein